MVQRKPVHKLGIQAETRNHVRSEKQSASRYEDVRTTKGGGGDLKMKVMKKARSFKLSNSESFRSKIGSKIGHLRFSKLSVDVSTTAVTPQKKTPSIKISDGPSPNYMKPTSSSDARKESLQVSNKSQTTNKSQSPKGVNSLKPSASGHKSLKTLRRTSSLKPVRPSMKKSSGVSMYSGLNVERATCSSTLKDSKFPAYVDLNPGGTEAEGTSIMKVCPYAYCSLNGHHHHEPLPPLKRFLSARRRLLRTQKSMKFKERSAPKRKFCGDSKKQNFIDEKEINGDIYVIEADSGDSAISSLTEDVDTDFFIEIYAKSRVDIVETEQISQSGTGFQDYEEMSFSGDYEKERELSEASEIDMEGLAKKHKDEAQSETGSQLDVFMTSELDKCDIQIEDHNTDSAETDSNHCLVIIDLDGESLAEESDSGASEMDWEDAIVPYSDDHGTDLFKFYDNEPSPKTLSSTEDKDCGVHDELEFMANDAYIPQQVLQDTENYLVGFVIEDPEIDHDIHLNDAEQFSEIHISCVSQSEASPEKPNEKSKGEVESDKEFSSENVPLGNLNYHGYPTDVECEAMGHEQAYNSNHTVMDQGAIIQDQSSVQDTDAEVKPGENEVEDIVVLEDASCLLKIQISDTKSFSEPEKEIAHKEASPDQTHAESEVHQSDSITQENAIDLYSTILAQSASSPHCSTSNNQLDCENIAYEQEKSVKYKTQLKGSILSNSSFDGSKELGWNKPSLAEGCKEVETEVSITSQEEDKTVINLGPDSRQSVIETSPSVKQFYKRGSKRTTEEDWDSMKKFNPRAPRFLPLEPDPDAEKVDLRHHMMDEKKSAEEWMLDFALRQTVNKLWPSRKRRVALLVEAFEAVLPIPKCETQLQRATPGFAHTRPLQACN